MEHLDTDFLMIRLRQKKMNSVQKCALISHHFLCVKYELKCCADGFKTKLFLHPGDPRPLTL